MLDDSPVAGADQVNHPTGFAQFARDVQPSIALLPARPRQQQRDVLEGVKRRKSMPGMIFQGNGTVEFGIVDGNRDDAVR